MGGPLPSTSTKGRESMVVVGFRVEKLTKVSVPMTTSSA